MFPAGPQVTIPYVQKLMKTKKKMAGSRPVRKTAEGGGNSTKRNKEAKRKMQASAAGIAGASVFKGPDWQSKKIADFYRPLKKPVTLRLDADVIAWFKKDGSRYQTRINQALRRVMESGAKKS